VTDAFVSLQNEACYTKYQVLQDIHSSILMQVGCKSITAKNFHTMKMARKCVAMQAKALRYLL